MKEHCDRESQYIFVVVLGVTTATEKVKTCPDYFFMHIANISNTNPILAGYYETKIILLNFLFKTDTLYFLIF